MTEEPSYEQLMFLVVDLTVSSFITRNILAANSNCPSYILEILYKKICNIKLNVDNFHLLNLILKNPNCPVYIFEILSDDNQKQILLSCDGKETLMSYIIENKNVPLHILKKTLQNLQKR